MTGAPIGYPTLNLGLNNQKIALLGLFERALSLKRPVTLPRISLFDPQNKEHPSVEFEAVFDRKALQSFADAFGIDVVESFPASNENGWGCFLLGSGCVGRHSSRGLSATGDYVCQFFNHLVPRITDGSLFGTLRDTVYNRLGIQTAIQLRIEKDWAKQAETVTYTLPGEDFNPSFMNIIEKVKKTIGIPCGSAYVVCDEANLPVSKDEIRHEVMSKFGMSLVWKSDILSPAELSKHSILDLALIDFEMAVRAPFFVGTSRSTFSDLAIFEAFCRSRRKVTTHYIYNVPGEALGRRMDNGSATAPNLVIHRLLSRDPLLDPSDEDCRLPAILTAHMSMFGDVSSEGSGIAGIRGEPLVCGVRDSGFDHQIEGFSFKPGEGFPVGIEYRALCDDGSWTSWASDGAFVGTRGVNRQILGYAVKTVGPLAARFQCICAGSFLGQREITVVNNGMACYAPTGAKLQAMQIVLRLAAYEWAPLMAVGRTNSETLVGDEYGLGNGERILPFANPTQSSQDHALLNLALVEAPIGISEVRKASG